MLALFRPASAVQLAVAVAAVVFVDAPGGYARAAEDRQAAHDVGRALDDVEQLGR